MPKTIVICCDGTTNQMTSHETNVLRIYRAAVGSQDQLTFYDPGVGTLADPMALTKTRKFVERSLDAAIGRSLCQNFSDAYQFLSRHYVPGDQIYMFGFSRGAYTVRAVAGAIHMLGLIRPELSHLAPYVWAIYANDGKAYSDHTRFGGAVRFQQLFCMPHSPPIRFMGLWDTVSSFGWFWDFQTLPYTAYNPSVEQVRHAISIDEHRVAFPSNLVMKDGEPVMTKEIKQIWFPGVHSDVGGGYPDAEAGLSKIAFEWMVQELRDVGGIHFDDAVIDQILGKGGGKYSPPDPNAAKHETLSGFWHLMEWLPRRRWHKIEDDGAQVTTDRQPAPARKNKPLWVKRWVAPHLYRRRKIPSGAWMHPAVRERKGYAPKLPADCVDVVRFPGRGFLPAEKRRQSPQ